MPGCKQGGLLCANKLGIDFIDPDTMELTRKHPPVSLGSHRRTFINDLKVSRRGSKSWTPGPPRGYLFLDSNVKAVLPDRIWQKTRTRVNELFKTAGELEAVYVSESDVHTKFRLIDAVVRIYWNSAQASVDFRRRVYNQLITSGHNIPVLKSLAFKYNSKPGEYLKVDVGRSCFVKEVFGSTLVCITEGAVALAEAFNVWAGILTKKTKTTLSTINTAPEAEQLSFGIALGNVIAHELRHQLTPTKNGIFIGNPHSGTGLGKDGADFSDPKITFDDKDTIRKNVTNLREIQFKFKGNLL